MTDAQLNPTPKSRFQSEDANIKAHHALLENPAFQISEDAAVLTYNRIMAFELSQSQDKQVQGMVNAYKMQGVQEFLQVFRTLAEKAVEVRPPGLARVLDHQAQS